MKDASRRFKYVEHPSMMFIGVIYYYWLISSPDYRKSRKIKSKTIKITFLVALIVICLRTPWDKLM